MLFLRIFLHRLTSTGIATMLLISCGGSSSGATPPMPVSTSTTTTLASTTTTTPVSTTTTTVQNGSSLQYFGFALVDCGYDDPRDTDAIDNYAAEVAPLSNMAQMCVFDPGELVETRLDEMRGYGMKAMLSVQEIFFIGEPDPTQGSGTKFSIRSDYQERWNVFIQNNHLDQHLSSIAAFYVADEPIWNGISSQHLKIAADAIKTSFPTIPTAFIEVAAGIDLLEIPESIDWVGFNRYAVDNPDADLQYRSDLELLKSKRSRVSQKILLVMDTHWLPSYGEVGVPESYMATVATSYYTLAKSDPEIVAMIGYTWPGGFDEPGQKGARELPENVTAEYLRIGKLITGK